MSFALEGGGCFSGRKPGFASHLGHVNGFPRRQSPAEPVCHMVPSSSGSQSGRATSDSLHLPNLHFPICQMGLVTLPCLHAPLSLGNSSCSRKPFAQRRENRTSRLGKALPVQRRNQSLIKSALPAVPWAVILKGGVPEQLTGCGIRQGLFTKRGWGSVR